jgi:hypothetical protein
MGRKDLEDGCSFLVESIKTMKVLAEREGPNLPALLKVSLDRLIRYDLY